MKSSYKIALIVVGVICVTAIFYATRPPAEDAGDAANTGGVTQNTREQTQGTLHRQTGADSQARERDTTARDNLRDATQGRPAQTPTTTSPAPAAATGDSSSAQARQNDVWAQTQERLKRAGVIPSNDNDSLLEPIPSSGITDRATDADNAAAQSGDLREDGTPALTLGENLGQPDTQPTDADNRTVAQTTPPAGDNRQVQPTTQTTQTPQTTQTTQTTSPREHVVKSRETLSIIAEHYFGSQSKWVDIAQANPTIDPNRLRVGQRLKLPALSEVQAREAEQNRPVEGRPGERIRTTDQLVHTVRSGETLSSIAAQYYGNEGMWHEIHDMNRSEIGPNPNRLKEGMQLIIPPAPNRAR